MDNRVKWVTFDYSYLRKFHSDILWNCVFYLSWERMPFDFLFPYEDVGMVDDFFDLSFKFFN